MEFIYSLILNLKIRLFDSNNYYIFIPILILILSFLETSSPIGFILPSNIISILFFTFIFNYSNIFIYIFILYFFGIFLGLLVGYYLGYYFNDKINTLTKKRFPVVDKYFLKIDHYFDKYRFLTFFLICNIPYVRSYFAIHMGSRHYNFSRYFLGSLFFSFFYVLPRASIGFLIGKFGEVIVYRYLHNGKIVINYLLLSLIIILIVFLILKYKNKKNLNK